MKINTKKNIIFSIPVIIILVIFFVSVLNRQKSDKTNKEQKIINTENKTDEIPSDDISQETYRTLESLVEYADPDHKPNININKEKNIFVLQYEKLIGKSTGYVFNDTWVEKFTESHVAVAIGDESKKDFRLVLDIKIPTDMRGMSWMRFIDFNGDGLEDIYIVTYSDSRTTHADGFVIIQKSPGEFVLAGRQSKDLFQYTSGVGAIPEFKDVDGDGSIEIITTDLENFDAYYIRVIDQNTGEIVPPGKITAVITRTIKLKGLEFYLLKEVKKDSSTTN